MGEREMVDEVVTVFSSILAVEWAGVICHFMPLVLSRWNSLQKSRIMGEDDSPPPYTGGTTIGVWVGESDADLFTEFHNRFVEAGSRSTSLSRNIRIAMDVLLAVDTALQRSDWQPSSPQELALWVQKACLEEIRRNASKSESTPEEERKRERDRLDAEPAD